MLGNILQTQFVEPQLVDQLSRLQKVFNFGFGLDRVLDLIFLDGFWKLYDLWKLFWFLWWSKVTFRKIPQKVDFIPEGARSKVCRHFEVWWCLLQQKQMSNSWYLPPSWCTISTERLLLRIFKQYPIMCMHSFVDWNYQLHQVHQPSTKCAISLTISLSINHICKCSNKNPYI